MKIEFSILLLVTYIRQLILAEPFAKQLTIYINAGRSECVFQPITKGERINIEYQVINGGGGGMDISFALIDPHQSVIVLDEQKERQEHKIVPVETGVYSLCFDNQFSSFHRKTVSFLFEVIAVDAAHQEKEFWTKEMLKDYHMTFTYVNISGSLENIRLNLMRSRQLQDFLRAHEARDRNLAEAICSLVNVWSCTQFCAMIIVGFLQVYMVRSIFEKGGYFRRFCVHFWRC